MAKFSLGDTIVPIEGFQGVKKATIYKIDKENYYCNIMNGKAIIPIKSEIIYKLEDEDQVP